MLRERKWWVFLLVTLHDKCPNTEFFADLCFPVSGLFSRSVFWFNFGIFYVRFHLIGICIILEVRNFNWKSEIDHDGSWNWYYKEICMFGLSQHDEQWESGAQRRYRNDAPFSIYVSSRYHRLSYYYLSKILTASAKQLFCGTVDKLII